MNRYVYQAPLKKKLPHMNDYIVKFKQTGDYKYFTSYLAISEHYKFGINFLTHSLCNKYHLKDRFDDVKSEIVQAYLERLPKYDEQSNVDFMVFINPYATFAVQEYARKHRGLMTCGSSAEFKRLRKANGIYYRGYEEDLSDREKLKFVSEEMELPEKKIEELLQMGTEHLFYKSLNVPTVKFLDDTKKITYYEVADSTPDAYTAFSRSVMLEGIYRSFVVLKPADKYIFLEAIGVCGECLEAIPSEKQLSYDEIANEMMMISTSAVQKKCRAVENTILKCLGELGIITRIFVNLDGKEDIGDGLTRFVYKYYVDAKVPFGIIDNIHDDSTGEFWGYDVVKLCEKNPAHADMAIELLQTNNVGKKPVSRIYHNY